MAPSKKSAPSQKKPKSTATSSSSKQNPASKPSKSRSCASSQKTRSARPPQATIVVAGRKHLITVADEDNDGDDGGSRPSKKRRKTGGQSVNAHDFYAVRELPPPRDYGFGRKSIAHHMWGTPFNPVTKSVPETSSDRIATSSSTQSKVVEVAASKGITIQPEFKATSSITASISRTTSPDVADDTVSKTVSLLGLPVEVRENIYKHILVSEKPIQVRQGWSAVHPRAHPGLRTAILRVCRLVRNEAINVLYGENTFLYRLRETAPPPAPSPDDEIVVQPPSTTEEPPSEHDNSEDDYVDNDLLWHESLGLNSKGYIDIRRYGHKFRKLMIVVEGNRTERGYLHSMAAAIAVFRNLKPLRPRVHTITIEITPMPDRETGELSFLDFFEKRSEVMRTLKALPCQFIEIVVNTDRDGSAKERIKLNMKYAANIRRARRGEKDVWKDDVVMQAYRMAQAGEAQAKLEQLPRMIRDIWEGRNGRCKKRFFDEFDFDFEEEEDYSFDEGDF
ncbi:hypothetical protein CCHL11_04638 [Colletotrichum chlorophyti]|uniref:Uncharacterized protein n=1 Tax=Colletotrichum chlorophyti TaxID=708187 RepID=A0A1Q8RRE6_9PEZI|nr:hypothetical protein CCHL11_04638 [Colletotrichum chlorophyti]